MRIARTPDGLPEAGCVLVPTMGALHEGHLSLVRIAAERGGAGPVVVSVFVNPTQFNDARDLQAYPRDLARDVELCARAGADVVFAPDVEVVYPSGVVIPKPELPEVATEPKLEDAGRPGHFAGVCQVVSRLFDLCRPQTAVFGEKDWQQLQAVRAMVRQQQRAIEIWAGPIVREADGLAMSSRNVRLTPAGRRDALALSRAVEAAGLAGSVAEAEARMRGELERVGAEVQYAVVRDAQTLMPIDDDSAGDARALVCAIVGGVRLLDNGRWPNRGMAGTRVEGL